MKKVTKSSSFKDSPKQTDSPEPPVNEEMTASAHFGGSDEENEDAKLDSNEFRFQLMKSNNITKKLTAVFSTLVTKIKDLEAQNKNLALENEELKKQNGIKDRIILEKNTDMAEKDKRIEEMVNNCNRLEKEMMKNRSKISQAMNMAFERGAPELVEFIERDILSVSSKP